MSDPSYVPGGTKKHIPILKETKMSPELNKMDMIQSAVKDALEHLEYEVPSPENLKSDPNIKISVSCQTWSTGHGMDMVVHANARAKATITVQSGGYAEWKRGN